MGINYAQTYSVVDKIHQNGQYLCCPTEEVVQQKYAPHQPPLI